ncbi:PCRF domain-containing protein, partial [Candidatus Gracilibacteria bacterium]|nr:PCRF domain-containing protein [Candidatus Gracilibacteria bacterium]
MHELKSHLEELKRLIEQGALSADLGTKREELGRLNAEVSREGFWDDVAAAQEVSQRASDLAKTIESWESVSEEVAGLLALLPEVDSEMEEEFKGMVKVLDEKWGKLEIATFLSGPHDESNAIMSIYAGTGGTDAADFAEMLLRMYLRYAERMGFVTEVLERSDAEEAGIKSVSFTVKGQFAYGYLQGEHGVHRLVRTSPFNSKGSRETSFAMVEVLPEIKAADRLEFEADDLRIDVFRAGGKGGQSVNTTDSAVR